MCRIRKRYAMIKLDIISDPVCPWCMIGKSRLDRALEARVEHPFEIEWHPFQLNPGMPAEGMDRPDYLEMKFGGMKEAASAYAQVDEAARDSGVEVEWGAIPRIYNTLDAHRLIHWAGLEKRQTVVVSALFRAYWHEARDISDAQVLTEIAEKSGLDGPMIARLLQSDADREDLRQREAHSRERGVTAVPTFIIANAHVVSGAQPAETWIGIIDDILAQAQNE